RRAGINVNKLTTGFRQLFGCSVYAFVREQRMAQAHALLAAGAMSVSEAAYACGYTDSHFSKAFQRRYGVLPSALAAGR
ncbi:helix-turn-helix transcriptional regulator, partial [Achromobacter insuavis]